VNDDTVHYWHGEHDVMGDVRYAVEETGTASPYDDLMWFPEAQVDLAYTDERAAKALLHKLAAALGR